MLTIRNVVVLITLNLMKIGFIDCFVDLDYLNRKGIYLDAKVGSYVILNCPLDFPQDIPIPYIVHWQKDEQRVFSWYDGTLRASDSFIGRINLLGNHYGLGRASVNLSSIRESDTGWYECKVLFPNRTPSITKNGTWFHVAVEGGSLIKIPPINQTIMEGKTAFFHCVTKRPDTSYVTWFKDGVALTELHDLAQRSFMGPDGSLSIDPTIMSDLGEFVCVVKNTAGEEQSARAYLNIQYKAKVIYAPQEVYLPYGQPAILDCHFRSNPPLTNLRWEKDGFLFDPYNVQGVFYKRNGSLYFSTVDETHNGKYSCTPYNDLGTDGPSPLIQVIVQRPPQFTLKPKPIYMTKLGETVTMTCDATDRDGSHRALIQWTKKDGTALPFSRVTYEGSNITIERINETDRGIYQCVATNEAASITADTEIMIENVPPRPPYNLSANSSDSAITLRWEPGYVRSYLEYVVWYRLSEAAEWRTMKLLSRHLMEATITNLLPGHEYEFMVLSQDRYGDGMFSKAFKYWTKPIDFLDNPSELRESHQVHQFAQIGPPRNVTVAEKPTGDGFVVSWDPPEYGLESLRVYLIRWYREPGHFLHGTAETREHYYTVKHLNEDHVYTFQVFSLSHTDYQAGSNEFEILVPPYRRVRAIAIGTTCGLLLILTASAVFLYVKKRCFNPYKDTNEKS
ncbi:hypothetical protein HA402_008096 [Bradysia odoriphaga]|nr:hypothetical protein HA402_008096 [Bradysia odoriphaga]